MNKIIFPKLFGIFETINPIENYNTNPAHPNYNYALVEIILNNIEKIFETSTILENEEFYQNFLNFTGKFEELVNHYFKNNWRILKKISYIFKSNNLYKNNLTELYISKIFSIAKKLFTNECNEIRIEAVKIMARICISKNYRDEILKFIELEIFSSKNFYNRRLYLFFFEEMLNIFSYKFLKEKGLVDDFMTLLNDNKLILTKFFKITKIFFPLIKEDRIKFLFLNKLEYLRKEINNKQLSDIELIQVNFI